jgi:uncharacterized phage protein (TIGR02220 family)/predicted phage replisome organizer
MPEGDKIIVIWVQLLCLAGKTNDGGLVYVGQNMAYTEEMLATLFDEKLNIVRIAIQTLEQFGMIEVTDNGLIGITNWEKHQSTDKMARMKEQSRIRQQKYYYRNKLRELGIDVDVEGFTDDLEELKELHEQLEEKPNVRLTLANDTEVRSKKKEVRGKKEEVNKDHSTAKAERIPYKEIIDYLNEQTGRRYSHKAAKNQDLIKARWNEGFRVDDFKQVIDTKVKDWSNDSKMNQYLRPVTLFSNKFDDYLNQVPVTKAKEQGANHNYTVDLDELLGGG